MVNRKSSKYSDAFREDAVRQVTERGYKVTEVAQRLDISSKTLYGWKQRYLAGKGTSKKGQLNDEHLEIARLKADLKRVIEERDILKKAAAYFARESR